MSSIKRFGIGLSPYRSCRTECPAREDGSSAEPRALRGPPQPADAQPLPRSCSTATRGRSREADVWATENLGWFINDPEKDAGLPFDAVSLPTADGTSLRGWFVPGPSTLCPRLGLIIEAYFADPPDSNMRMGIWRKDELI